MTAPTAPQTKASAGREEAFVGSCWGGRSRAELRRPRACGWFSTRSRPPRFDRTEVAKWSPASVQQGSDGLISQRMEGCLRGATAGTTTSPADTIGHASRLNHVWTYLPSWGGPRRSEDSSVQLEIQPADFQDTLIDLAPRPLPDFGRGPLSHGVRVRCSHAQGGAQKAAVSRANSDPPTLRWLAWVSLVPLLVVWLGWSADGPGGLAWPMGTCR